MVDSVDVARLGDAAEELARLLLEERLEGAPLLVMANKQDVRGALAPEALEGALALEKLAHRKHLLQACSAVAGDGVREGFAWVVKTVAERMYVAD